MNYSNILLTIDVDWASDEMIMQTFSMLKEKNVKSTWFFTHETPCANKLLESGIVEVGIHPNFLKGSTHGVTVEEVIDHMVKLFPEAVSTRSHGVQVSGEILYKMLDRSKIRIDSSYFLPGMNYIYPVEQKFPNGKMLKLPFVWSDDYQLVLNDQSGKQDLNVEGLLAGNGLKVINFHPVHVFMNTPDLKTYALLKNKQPVQPGLKGSRNYLEEILDHVAGKKTATFQEICNLGNL